MKFNLAALAGALTFCAGAAYAGGFWLEVETPKPGDARMKNAVLVFRAEGCHGPGSSISGTAEGIVNGKRKSIPLTFKSPATETFTITRQWPKEGRWALAVTAASKSWTHQGQTHQAKSSIVVELTDSGAVLVSDPKGNSGRSEIVVRRPQRETLAELVEKTLKGYQTRRAAL